MSPQTSLLLPWQPGSEKRVTWEKHSKCPQACHQALPPASLHLPHVPTFPGLVFSLPWVFSAGLWNREGVRNCMGLPFPHIALLRLPYQAAGPHPKDTAHRDYHHCSQLPGPHNPVLGAGKCSFPSFQAVRTSKPFGIYTFPLYCHGH